MANWTSIAIYLGLSAGVDSVRVGGEPGFGFGEVLDEGVTAGAGVGFGSGDQERVAKAGGVGGGYVGAAVAYEDGAREVEGEVAGGAEQHAGGGFAVGVLAAEFAYAVLGVVRAVVDGVEEDLLLFELVAYAVHQVFEVLRGVEAAGIEGAECHIAAHRQVYDPRFGDQGLLLEGQEPGRDQDEGALSGQDRKSVV